MLQIKPRIVVTGINLVEAGPMSILKDALAELSCGFSHKYEIYALVYKRDMFDFPEIRFLEYPEVKSSWLRRIKFEYYDLRKISRELNAHLWLSLHDMTPRVHAKIQAVYCHNPTPFTRLKLSDLIYGWKYSLFVLFYRYLYRINIHRNDFVVVQQEWIRHRFREMYRVKNVIVAHPRVAEPTETDRKISATLFTRSKYIFFFPALPRVFKNIEILIKTGEILRDNAIEIWLTFSGKESRYARRLAHKARQISNIKLLGRLTRDQVFECYDVADCLVFPSRLETWGLPISEFKRTGKPMLLADLPHAHETIGTYNCAYFFDPNDPEMLASLMQGLAQGLLPGGSTTAAAIAPPFAAGWRQLFDILLGQERRDIFERQV